MAKKHASAEGKINTEGWMMSYADMATILLAMFVVLSTLGKDQTGVNLYSGTGSFKHALDCFGLPGWFDSGGKAVQMDAPSPHYLTNPQNAPPDPLHDGQEEGKEGGRVIDIELEQMQRFLQDLGKHFTIEKLPRSTGEAVVDFYDRLNPSTPLLNDKQGDVIWQVVPALNKSDFRVFVIVWATTPADSAWIRAANQAKAVADEIAAAAQLDATTRGRLIPLGQPWPYAKIRRPVMSVVISKLEAAS
jgi:hypothetical protein